jgi:hypothetical protein
MCESNNIISACYSRVQLCGNVRDTQYANGKIGILTVERVKRQLQESKLMKLLYSRLVRIS